MARPRLVRAREYAGEDVTSRRPTLVDPRRRRPVAERGPSQGGVRLHLSHRTCHGRQRSGWALEQSSAMVPGVPPPTSTEQPVAKGVPEGLQPLMSDGASREVEKRRPNNVVRKYSTEAPPALASAIAQAVQAGTAA